MPRDSAWDFLLFVILEIAKSALPPPPPTLKDPIARIKTVFEVTQRLIGSFESRWMFEKDNIV